MLISWLVWATGSVFNYTLYQFSFTFNYQLPLLIDFDYRFIFIPCLTYCQKLHLQNLRMKPNRILILFFIAFFSSSCAKNLLVNYPAEPGNTNELVLKFNKASHKIRVSLNDKLIVDGKLARSVTIQNLPDGQYDIRCSSYSGWQKERVCASVQAGFFGTEKSVIRTIDLPVENGWYWVGITSLLVWPLVLVAGFTL